jgi:aspartyl/glutamyl-tRNA(Asn/Gln) amidotransferase C subunit
MSVNKKIVRKISYLSKIYLCSNKERKEIVNSLNEMVLLINKLEDLNIFGIEPLFNMSSEVNVLKSDLDYNSFLHKEYFLNSNNITNFYFLVPKI